MDARVVAAVLALLLALALYGWARSAVRARRRWKALDGAKRSQSTRYGQITEQFAPFLPDWPWDPKGFRFLGHPIDGVQFDADGIVFVEIKSAGSTLSPAQRQVRDHIAAGRVRWELVRIG